MEQIEGREELTESSPYLWPKLAIFLPYLWPELLINTLFKTCLAAFSWKPVH